jgi:hypothetical protein
MILAIGSFKAVVTALGIGASAVVAGTHTCQKLEGLYQANVATVDAALQAFEQCSAQAHLGSCSTETRALVTAREELQAAFGDYLKTCGSRTAREELPAKPPSRRSPAKAHTRKHCEAASIISYMQGLPIRPVGAIFRACRP